MSQGIVGKIKKAINNPRLIKGFLKRKTINIMRKSLGYVVHIVDGFRRKKLLSQSYSGWDIVRTPPQKLAGMPFSHLSSVLSDMNNNFIDWGEKKHQVVAGDFKFDVSIIILVLNNLDMTLRCIESVLVFKNKASVEVIVVDNGSSAETIAGLRRFIGEHPQVKLIHIDQNINFALGNNVGFIRSKGKISIFMNNDTYVTSDGWADQLIKSLKRRNVKMVQPTLLYPDNTLQCVGITFSSKSDIGYGMYAGRRFSKELVKDRKVRAVTGACLAIRSEDFLEARGFDPVFINGQEDVDLCLRVGGVGADKKGFVAASSIVYHDEGKTPGRGRFVSYNRQVFLDRWRGKIMADDIDIYKKDGYSVSRWRVDFKDFKEKGIEVYLPVLKRGDSK